MPPGIDKFHDVNVKNKTLISKFTDDLKGTGNLSQTTIDNYEKYIIKFSRFLGQKQLDKVTANDVKTFLRNVDYAISSKELLKMGLIKFYRWYYHTKRGAPNPKCVAEIEFIRSKVLERQRKEEYLQSGKEHIVCFEDYEKLINATSDAELKAMIETFYWYGCRISELLSMRIGGVTTNDVGVIITLLKSKTEPRQVTLANSEHYPKHLMNWIDNHPQRNDKNAPVWINLQHTKKYMQVLRRDSTEHMIGALSQRILGRHIHPHLFRHSALTRDSGNGIPWTHIATKYGLTKDSRQQRTYDHNSNKEFCDYFRQKPGFVKAPTVDEIKVEKERLEEEYSKRIAELENRMNLLNKILDEKMISGYIQTKQRLENIEQQKARDEEQLAFERGEL